MDWTTVIVSCVPAIISATVSYLVARHKGKNDLEKAAQENSAEIDRLMKQHEIDIEALREKHRMEMEAKDKDHEQKLQLMQKDYELRVAENKAQKSDDVLNDATASFFQSFLQNPEEGKQKLSSLLELQNMISGNK